MNNTINNQCSRCGKCCTPLLPIGEKETKAIKKYIAKKKIVPSNENINKCPFLTKDNSCSIYDIRPEICTKFICSTHIEGFNHRGKHIVDFWEVFFKGKLSIKKDRSSILDQNYQYKKKQVFGK